MWGLEVFEVRRLEMFEVWRLKMFDVWQFDMSWNFNVRYVRKRYIRKYGPDNLLGYRRRDVDGLKSTSDIFSVVAKSI